MCDYQGREFGAQYLDSVCIDGFLWDADSCDESGGALSHGGDIPCPQCNHEAWLEYQREEIEEMGWLAAEDGKILSDNPFPKAATRYPQDGEWYRLRWIEGFEQHSAELPSNQ